MDQITDRKWEDNNPCLQIERKRKDGFKEKETVQIEPDELLQMTDDTKSYNLKHYPRPFKPEDVYDFDYTQCAYVTALYGVGRISVKEYCAFCRARLEASVKLRFRKPSNLPVYIDPESGATREETSPHAIEAFRKRILFCQKFFQSCLPQKIVEKYENDYLKMLVENRGIEKNEEENPYISSEVGGERIGYYYDRDYEKNRPLTSRIERVAVVYPDRSLDQFRAALLEELKKLEAEAQQADENQP